jgi:hypothetical protein
MSGAKEKMMPADWAPKMTAMKQRKNWNMVYSPLPMRVPPYQKPRAKTRKVSDCEAA